MGIDSCGTIHLSAQEADLPRGFVTGISQGGDANVDDNDDYNSNGGRGGHGRDVVVRIHDQAHHQFQADAISRNFEGVVAQSGGGVGGEQNSSVFGNQKGGRGGDGGRVRMDNAGSILIGKQALIRASADFVAGIHAWSFGGRGGSNNGDSGNAGEVEVYHSGIPSAHGGAVVATSRGGDGGGIVGDATAHALAPLAPTEPGMSAAPGGGDGNALALLLNGLILTEGDGAYGVLAQSIGGGGDLSGSAGQLGAGGAQREVGHGGDINVQQNSVIMATGEDAVALFLQSEGSSGNGTV